MAFFQFNPITERQAIVTACIAALLVFAYDLSQPLGVAGGMPYVVLPLLAMLARSTRLVIIMAVGGTVLTITGLLLSPAGSETSVYVTNRTMSIALIWIVAYTTLRHLKVGHGLRQQLREQAATDPLTGLYNRRHIFSCLDREIKRYDRYREAFSIVLIDADHFKHVNDNYGHSTGDATLRLIARVCKAAVRETDIVGRFGGEEFIILLPHTSAEAAGIVAERIRKDIGKVSRELLDGAVLVTLSLGVAEVDEDTADFNMLLAAADSALYQAKNAGRDRVAIRQGKHSKIRAEVAA